MMNVRFQRFLSLTVLVISGLCMGCHTTSKQKSSLELTSREKVNLANLYREYFQKKETVKTMRHNFTLVMTKIAKNAENCKPNREALGCEEYMASLRSFWPLAEALEIEVDNLQKVKEKIKNIGGRNKIAT